MPRMVVKENLRKQLPLKSKPVQIKKSLSDFAKAIENLVCLIL